MVKTSAEYDLSTQCHYCGQPPEFLTLGATGAPVMAASAYGRDKLVICGPCDDALNNLFPGVDPADVKGVRCKECDGKGSGFSTEGIFLVCNQCSDGGGIMFSLKSPLEALAETAE